LFQVWGNAVLSVTAGSASLEVFDRRNLNILQALMRFEMFGTLRAGLVLIAFY
jgi:hypothetical protein